MGLKYRYVNNVKMSDLILDAENPRFASSMFVKNTGDISQESIIKHLLEFSNVVDLANRINSVKELHGSELITCYEKDGKYIVIEGNRRTCACKLLLDRELIPDNYKSGFPTITEETKENIEEITINVYPDRESVQAYLHDRHIKGVITWSSREKNNYYMNLYNQYNSIERIEEFTTDSQAEIRNCIIKYQFFMEVFYILKAKYKDVAIEKMDYLPLVNKFMGILLGKDKDVGLNLTLDETNLKHICPEDKKALYESILLIVGEAFLIRRDKTQCAQGEVCKVVSTELNNTKSQKKLIMDDVRISGLYSLIKEYKGIKEDDDFGKSSNYGHFKGNQSTLGKEDTTRAEGITGGYSDGKLNGDKDSNEGFGFDGEFSYCSNEGNKGSGSKTGNINSGCSSASDDNPNVVGTLDKSAEPDKNDPENINDEKFFPPSADPRSKNTPIGCLYFTKEEAQGFRIYGNSNHELKIRSLLRDLAGFSIYKHPYSCALLYRALLESIARMFFERHSKNLTRPYAEDRLADNLIYLNDNILFSNIAGKDIPKIKKAIKDNLTTTNIVEILNLYIHYAYPVDGALLLSSWKTMKIFIAKCLER